MCQNKFAMSVAVELPPPRDWQVFEDFCRDLFAAEWGDPHAQEHGRSGQKQHGVDLFGRRDGRWQAVQCKRKQRFPESKLTAAEVRREVEKAYKFSQRLETLVIATTARPDTGIQDLAARLTDEHAETSDERRRFRVVVYGWDDLCRMLRKHPRLHDSWHRNLLAPMPKKREVESGLLPIPRLPPHFLPRPEDLAPLKRAVLADGAQRLGVTGSARHLVGVQGMGGIGKTVLSVAACRDAQVQEAFDDGVVWIALGQEPNLLRLQQDLAKALGVGDVVLGSLAEGKRVLEEANAERSILLVLDDVWDLQHAVAFDVMGAAGRLLVTTRNREILVGLGAEEIQLDVLSPDQSRALLADWAEESPEDLPPTADQVAKECGYLPLALAMIGAMVRLRPTAWPDALKRLRRADLAKIRRQFPDYPYPDLLRALDVSVEALEAQERERYAELAVFPEDAAVSLAAVEVLWSMAGLDGLDARDLVDRLVARSLAQLDDEGRIRLHDLQGDYIRRQAGDARELHGRLLDGYRALTPEGFAQVKPDGYFHEHLTAHLAQAGQVEALHEILSDYRWLEVKVRSGDLQSLLADYDQLPALDLLRRVGQTLRLSAHVLVKEPKELPSQLVCRLLDTRQYAAIDRLLKGARRRGKAQGWIRPLRRSLEAPGGALLVTLEGHTDAVLKVIGLADGRVVSASDDSRLRVWNPQSGKTLQILDGHKFLVRSVAALVDGRVASGSNDRTIRIWDLQTGQTLQILKGHTGPVYAVAGLADGRLLSASNDHKIWVWDLPTGQVLQTLEGHSESITSLAILADGRVVSASYDRTLRVWDLPTGQSLQTLEGHSEAITGVASLADGRVVSASHDRTLRVWDLQTGQSLQTLEGHTDSVLGVAALADGRVVSASRDYTLRVWDPLPGKMLRSVEAHPASISCVAELADGQVVSGSHDFTLRVWDLQTEREEHEPLEGHLGPVKCLAKLADGRVITGANDGALRVWDPQTGKQLQTIEGPEDPVSAVAGLADGRVVSGTFEGMLLVWDLQTNQKLVTHERHWSAVGAIAELPGALFVSVSDDRTVCVWDPQTGKQLHAMRGHAGNIKGMAVLADGRVVSASDDGTLRVWDPQSGKQLQTIEVGLARPYGVVALADDRVVFACNDGTLRVWDPRTGQTLRTNEGNTGYLRDFAALAAGRVVSANDDTLRVWDSQTGKKIATFHAGVDIVCVVAGVGSNNLVAGDIQGRLHWLRFEKADS